MQACLLRSWQLTLLQWSHVRALLSDGTLLDGDLSTMVWQMLLTAAPRGTMYVPSCFARAVCVAHVTCSVSLPVDFEVRGAMRAATAKALANHKQGGVVPVKWEGSWAVLFLDTVASRYVLAGWLI